MPIDPRNPLAAACSSISFPLPSIPPIPSPPMQRPATACNPLQPLATSNKTNPPPPSSIANQKSPIENPLTPRHLAALRLLFAGHSIPAVAAQLHLSRQTLWRWSRLPAFRAELARLHHAAALSTRPHL